MNSRCMLERALVISKQHSFSYFLSLDPQIEKASLTSKRKQVIRNFYMKRNEVKSEIFFLQAIPVIAN